MKLKSVRTKRKTETIDEDSTDDDKVLSKRRKLQKNSLKKDSTKKKPVYEEHDETDNKTVPWFFLNTDDEIKTSIESKCAPVNAKSSKNKTQEAESKVAQSSSSPDQSLKLKSVRTKRKTETIDEDSTDDEKILPKRRKLTKKSLKKESPKKKPLYEEYDETDDDMDESSHDFWRDSDEDRRKKPSAKGKSNKASEEIVLENPPYFSLNTDDETKTSIESLPAPNNDKQLECPTCEVTFTTRRAYNSHKMKHVTLRPFECPTCLKKFKFKAGLKGHIKTQHSDDAPTFSCEMCDFTTKQEHYLQVHFTRKHTEEFKYRCSNCGKRFKVEVDYKAHMSNHETGPQVCDICGVSYPNKAALYSHKNYKHTEKNKPFECHICKKRLRTDKNLENHMQQHNQTYVCEECGMKFARQHSLSKHRKVHGEKSYLCPVCGRAFMSLTTQKVHMITHTGIRPYICNVCGSSYTQRSSLMLHWKKKHPDASEPPPPVTLASISETLRPRAD